MGVKLSDIEEGKNITLLISNGDGNLKLDAVIRKHIRDNLALIDVLYSDTKRLTFDNVQIDVEFYPENDVPLIWRTGKVVTYKTGYVLQVASDGVRHNRRGCFRVAVAATALCRIIGRGTQSVVIKDVSLSGFAIADRKKELNLAVGDLVSVTLEDLGFRLELDGRVVRTEEREDITIYGLEIRNICKDLSTYLSLKQRRNKKAEE